MPESIDAKDNEQDSRLTYLESKFGSYKERVLGMEAKLQTLVGEGDLDRLYAHIDKLEGKIKELDSEFRARIRKNEIWIAGAAAVISATITVIGIVIAADARPAHAFVEDGLMDEPCPLSLVKTSFVSDTQVIVKELKNGSDDPTKSEELL